MKLGLLGQKLGHSYSPVLFQAFFQKDLLSNASYELYELQDLDQFGTWLRKNPEVMGLNVTIPYKETILRYADKRSPEVQKIGAANTLKIRKGIVSAYNTDIQGFLETLGKSPLSVHKHCLILGTGGASKTVQYVLSGLGIPFQVASRTEKADYQYSNIPNLEQYSTIINCTPLGMSPNFGEKPSLSYGQLSHVHHLIDLIYNPSISAFLHEGNKQGATVTNGLAMLKAQAQAAWDIWRKD
jgi:shikimate dehydrogenase